MPTPPGSDIDDTKPLDKPAADESPARPLATGGILPPPAAPTWQQRAAARADNAAARNAAAPVQVRNPNNPSTVLRVHIEEISENRHRPELLSSPPGKTVLDAVGPRDVVATALRKIAHSFDPPWWMFWVHLRKRL